MHLFDACEYLIHKNLQSSLLPPAAIPRHLIRHAYRSMRPYNGHSFPKAGYLQFSNIQLKGNKQFFSIITIYIHVALTRIQNKAFLPCGSYASISDLYVFPMSPPNMYQIPSITKDLASLKKNKIGFDGIRKYVD